MRDFYHDELAAYTQIHSGSGLAIGLVTRTMTRMLFFTGIALLPPILMLPRALRDRRTRFFVLASLLWIPAISVQVFLMTHYLAAFTAAFYVIGLQCMRHLRQCRIGDNPTGLALVRLITVVCLVLLPLRALATPLHLGLAEWPGPPTWMIEWYGPGLYGEARAAVERQLESLPGQQLVLVRYAPDHHADSDWIANAPDIDGSKVIWAREMDSAKDLALIRYYKDRTFWLVQPDDKPTILSPYPVLNSASEPNGGNQ
jgi:hypothetical protein